MTSVCESWALLLAPNDEEGRDESGREDIDGRCWCVCCGCCMLDGVVDEVIEDEDDEEDDDGTAIDDADGVNGLPPWRMRCCACARAATAAGGTSVSVVWRRARGRKNTHVETKTRKLCA